MLDADGWNQRCHPFTWTTDADPDPAKLSVDISAMVH
jgi:hypothetical protein